MRRVKREQGPGKGKVSTSGGDRAKEEQKKV